METLTTDEARRLIEIAKNALIEIIDAPQPGTRLEFDASGKESKELVINHHFKWWFNISPPKGYYYCSPRRAVSQALLLAPL